MPDVPASAARPLSRDQPGETPVLAVNLRRLRHAADLTSDGLAERSGVSRAMISKIERGVSVPTATVLGKLAAALDVSLSHLLGTAAPRHPMVVRRRERSAFRDPDTGFERHSLSPLFEDRALDVALNVLPPRQRAAFPAHHAGVEEYLTVHDGSLTVVAGEHSWELSAGDTVFFPSDCPHEFHNDSDGVATFYVVVDDRSRR